MPAALPRRFAPRAWATACAGRDTAGRGATGARTGGGATPTASHASAPVRARQQMMEGR